MVVTVHIANQTVHLLILWLWAKVCVAKLVKQSVPGKAQLVVWLPAYTFDRQHCVRTVLEEYLRRTKTLRERPLNKQGEGRDFLKTKIPARDEAPPPKKSPNPAIRKSPAQLSKSYNCRICIKKILAPYIPKKNFSAPVCCERNIPVQEKIPAPLLI